MLITTTENITGYKTEILGIVQGSMVQSKNAIKDIGASIKTIVGGELTAYTEMMEEARTIATNRMIAQAQSLGADAIVSTRFSSSSVMQGAAELMAFGTAVKLTKL